jgi:hypothetical protein
MYSRKEFFALPWEKHDKYISLTLKKCKFQLRIYHRNTTYENWGKFTTQKGSKPWKLGTYSSFQEAQFYGQHYIIYFILDGLVDNTQRQRL